jgi:O-antigen/teichoic acid export membrane protein
MLVLSLFAGQHFIQVFFGPDFAEAYLPLVLMVATAGFTLIGFPMDPALYAMGRPSVALRIDTVVIAAVYVPTLVLLTRLYGPTGAAASSLLTAVASALGMTFFTVVLLRRRVAAMA